MSAPSYKNCTYTLYAAAGSFRAFPILIAAEYKGVNVNVIMDTVSSQEQQSLSTIVFKLSPSGKAPLLVVERKDKDNRNNREILWSAASVARFVASAELNGTCNENDAEQHHAAPGLHANLLGKSLLERAQVDAWMDYCAAEIELPVCVWFYPVAGYMPFHAEPYAKAKNDLCEILKRLDDHLASTCSSSSSNSFFVGHHVTLADICIASALFYPFKFLADEDYRKPYAHVERWFTACVDQPEFVAVVGKVFSLCQRELLAPGHQVAVVTD